VSDQIAIDVQGLGKRYVRGSHRKHFPNWRAFLMHKVRTLLRIDRREASTEEFWALRGASFTIRRGENVGIIGLNGAGKSTLLKLLSRITEPTEGRARITGRVGALLEVGTGFHPELTGRENVFLYGSILGMSREEVERKLPSIIEFSEIADFIETPVKRYSSGMYVRLAFSVAAHMDPEILFLDEVLAVGDLSFQRKCMEYAKRLQEKDATILFVSHTMFSIKSMCDRVIYIRKGQVVFDGPVEEGIAIYEQDCRYSTAGGMWGQPEEWPIAIQEGRILGASGEPGTVFDMGEPLTIQLRYKAKEALKDPNFIVTLVRSDNVVCSSYSTEVDGIETGTIHGEGNIELRLPPLKLVAEMYTVKVVVRKKGFQDVLCNQIVTTMHVRHDLLDSHFGVFHEQAAWKLD
jgi:lipopolysaccharide transport system ATP-binding protein